MRNQFISAVLAIAITAFGCPTAVAQQPVSNAALLYEYTSGANKRALEVAGRRCPEDDPSRRRLLQDLLRLHQDELRKQEYAGHFAYALQNCATPELHKWFRDSLMSSKDPFTALALGFPLAKSSTAENLSAIENLVFRVDVLPEIRSEVFLATKLSARERMARLVSGIAAGKNIPIEMFENEFRLVLDVAERSAARGKLLFAIEQNPSAEQAASILAVLVSEAVAAKNPVWNDQISGGLKRLTQNSLASHEVRLIAGEALKVLKGEREK